MRILILKNKLCVNQIFKVRISFSSQQDYMRTSNLLRIYA